MRTLHMKVKVCSLAEEAKIIKKVSFKTLNSDRFHAGDTNYVPKYPSLYQHRIDVVKHEARHASLVYGAMRGVPYEKMERKCKVAPNLDKLADQAKRFGIAEEVFKPWLEAAKVYLKAQKFWV